MHWMTRWSVGILVSFAAIAIPGCLERPETPEKRWIFANPLAVVEVGEWASYRLSDGNSWRMEVVDGAGSRGLVTVKERTRRSDVGETLSAPVKRLHRNHILNGYEAAGWTVMLIYEDTVEVARQSWKSLCVEYLTRGHGVVKVWYSHEIPVYGLLKQVAKKPSGQETVHVELVDWSGRSEK